ncbi:type-1 angiotensin II receptor [Amia ocellicauda]|uniref:type-1 angiotensin II receptor n=1 Tax=Amia ocellicauda TaxID=2972642 RepID=UPI003463E50E
MVNCTKVMDLTLPQNWNPDLNCSYIHIHATLVFPVLYYILSLLGILGNLFSIWTCLWKARPWSIAIIGVLNLALCDLAFLISILPWAIYLANNYNWNMGHTLCVIVSIVYFTGLTSSTMFICAISTDRFLAVTFPLKSRLFRTTRNAALVSLAIWALTVLLMYLSYHNILYKERRDGTCFCGALVLAEATLSGAPYNLLSYYSVQVAIPLLIVTPSYAKILAKMVQSQRRWGIKNVRGRHKTIWLITLFIANFLICWVPGQLLQVIACVLFLTLDNCENNCWVTQLVNLLMEVSQLFELLNAGLNPLIFHLQEGVGQRLWLLCRRGLRWLVSWGRWKWRWKATEAHPTRAAPVELISVAHLSVNCGSLGL